MVFVSINDYITSTVYTGEYNSIITPYSYPMVYYVVNFNYNHVTLQEDNTLYGQVLESGEISVKSLYLSSTQSNKN